MSRVARFKLPDGRVARYSVPDDFTPPAPPSDVQNLAAQGSKAAIAGISMPLVNPISSRLEAAGEKVRSATQGAIGNLVERGGDAVGMPFSPSIPSPILAAGGTAASMVADAGALTPSNLSLGIGSELTMGANALPFRGEKTLGQTLLKPAAQKVDQVLGIPGAKSKVQQGMKSFLDYFKGIVTPQDKEITAKLIAPHLDKPVTDTSAVVDEIGNQFTKKRLGLKTKATPLTENQAQNFKDAVSEGKLTEDDVKNLIEHGLGLEGEVRKIGSSMSPPVTSDLPSAPTNEYKIAARTLNSLSKKDLTYNDLNIIQNDVGEFAFSKPEPDRTPVQKFMGRIYGKLNDVAQKTAEEGGFLKEHNIVKEEGRKYFQKKFLDEAAQASRKFGAKSTDIDYGKLLNEFPKYDADIKRLFGNKEEYANALRNLSSVAKDSFGGSNQGVGVSVGASGMPHGYVKPTKFLGRFTAPTDIDAVVERNFPSASPAEKQKIKDMLFPGSFLKPKVSGGISSAAAQTLRMPLSNENQ